MLIDSETQGAVDSISAAGFTVNVEITAEGHWLAQAVNQKTREESSVEADDSFAATAELAHRLGIPLEIN